MSLFVRFNQRLENNRYPCPSASRTHKHPGVIERGRWVKTTPVWPGGVRLSCAFFGPHKEQSAGYNSRTESQRVCGECHRSSRAVCFYGTGCFNGAVVSPSLRLWTDDRRDSRLNLDPSKTTLWIWNGACRWAKFSASEKHQNHGQSSAVSAKSCWISPPPLSLCVLTFPSGCLTDGAALTETAASRCGCSMTGWGGLIPGDCGCRIRLQALWWCHNVVLVGLTPLFLFVALRTCASQPCVGVWVYLWQKTEEQHVNVHVECLISGEGGQRCALRGANNKVIVRIIYIYTSSPAQFSQLDRSVFNE